jgi:hypothetical protein
VRRTYHQGMGAPTRLALRRWAAELRTTADPDAGASRHSCSIGFDLVAFTAGPDGYGNLYPTDVPELDSLPESPAP